MYHDQALLKEPGGGFTPWHQDQHYVPLDTDNTIITWMPLVDLTPEMGTLHFASGSHRQGYLGRPPIQRRVAIGISRVQTIAEFPCRARVAMRAGDATFHYGHCTGLRETRRRKCAK